MNTKSLIPRWPRSGGDAGNRSVMNIPGPVDGRIQRRVVVHDDTRPVPGVWRPTSGGAVAVDGTLRVVVDGRLFALTAAGDLLWQRDLDDWRILPDDDLACDDLEPLFPDDDADDAAFEDPPRRCHALPTIIGRDNTLMTMTNTAVIVDAHGQLVMRIEVPGVDDSTLAPNVDHEGRPILTTMLGDVFVWQPTGLHRLQHVYGYDLVPVAVFDDDTFAVAAYAGTGFCRVRQDGTLVWKTTLHDADLLPTINADQCAAVGSLNDQCSILFAPDGTAHATYPHAAVFAAYPDGGWIAVSEQCIARLSATGVPQWQYAMDTFGAWVRKQPLVDSDGQIYVLTKQAVVAFAPDGRHRFTLAFDDTPGPLFPAQAGILATVVDGTLYFIG